MSSNDKCGCGHNWGWHSGDHVAEHKCCEDNCDCKLSYNDLCGGMTYPTQKDRLEHIEEQLAYIISWITRQELEKMERDMT